MTAIYFNSIEPLFIDITSDRDSLLNIAEIDRKKKRKKKDGPAIQFL